MATNKLHAILESKIPTSIMTLSSADPYLDIEIEGDVENGKQRIRSQYSVKLSVAGRVVVKSTQSMPRSSVLKWEWNSDNEMWVLAL